MAEKNVIIVGRGQKDTPFIKDMTVSREHCHLTPNGDGTFVLEDMSAGGTYINGIPVCKTTVKLSDDIQLGDSYKAKVKDLIPKIDVFSIKPLESVWQKYHDEKLTLQRRQHGQGLLVRLPFIISGLAGAVTFMLPDNLKVFSFVIVILNLGLMVYGFIQQKNFVMADEIDKLDRWLQENYCCPNPDCHHFMGNIPYNILRQDKKCKSCGCKFTEK